MAHGDYDCCAICDDKMSFAYDAETKAYLCSSCSVGFYRRTGEEVTTAEGLIDWMQRTDPAVVVSTLRSMAFQTCYYYNDVDKVYEEILAKVDGGDG